MGQMQNLSGPLPKRGSGASRLLWSHRCVCGGGVGWAVLRERSRVELVQRLPLQVHEPAFPVSIPSSVLFSKSESCFSEMAHTCLEARIFSPHNSHVTVGRGGLLPSDCLPGRPPVNLSFAPLFPVMMVLTGIHPNVERSIFVSLTGAVYVVGLITSYKNCQYLSYLMKVL